MTDDTSGVPPQVALRRRYGRWNAGTEAPPGEVFFEPERGRWVVAAYEAALAIFERKEDALPDTTEACPFADLGEDMLSEARALPRKNLFFQSSPNLERLRRVLMLQIGPQALDRLEPQLRAALRDLLWAALASDKNEIEVVEEIVRPFIDRCLFDLVGAPDEDCKVLADLADTARGLFELGPTSMEARISYLAFGGLCRRAGALLFEGRNRGAPLVQGVQKAVYMGTWTRDEAVAQIAILMIAARTTPMTAVTSMIHLLATHPGVWAAAQNRTLSPDAIIEEALRVGPPAGIVPKTVIRDRDFHGATLKAGEKVLLLVGSANHDPAIFPDPDRFDPWRTRRRNLAFGAGRHKCPGQKLAYLQLSVILSEFLAAFPKLAIAAPPERAAMVLGERPITRLLIAKPDGARTS